MFREPLSDLLLTKTICRGTTELVAQLQSKKVVPRSSRCFTTVFKVFEKYLCSSSTLVGVGEIFFKDFDLKKQLEKYRAAILTTTSFGEYLPTVVHLKIIKYG